MSWLLSRIIEVVYNFNKGQFDFGIRKFVESRRLLGTAKRWPTQRFRPALKITPKTH